MSLKNTRIKCACRIWTQSIVYEGFVCVLMFDDVDNLDESDSKCWRIFLVSLVDATKLSSTTSQRDNSVNLQTTKSSPHIWFLCSHSFFPQLQNPEWTQLLFSALKQTTNFSQSWKIGCMQRKVWWVSLDELMISQSQRQIKLMDPTPSGPQHTKKKKNT